ncbi:sensor histidine kinase [Streptomyces sp. AD55]|uniref:sensor histidine kinase n=1 Tax=Streptomyces sp. AD55 TaxID=3242895 RepID=UPI003529B555
MWRKKGVSALRPRLRKPGVSRRRAVSAEGGEPSGPGGPQPPGAPGVSAERSPADAPGVPAEPAETPAGPLPSLRDSVSQRPTPQSRTAPKTTGQDDPSLTLQVNALQALCRQVFGFRLAMIALAAPVALLHAQPGLGARLAGAAVVVTFMGSYVLFRDWERFGPLLLRHPGLLAADTLFGSLLLVSAGPGTPLAYVSVCTPLLAGLVYGRRGAAVFAGLQSLILLLAHATLRDPHQGPAESLFLPGLCVIAGAAGSSLRTLLLRFGTATEALTAMRARLAATEAVGRERARLARELHDSVATTLHGVALAADGLTATAGTDRVDPVLVRRQSELIARSARRAAAESRELLTDLRRVAGPDHGVDLTAELAARAAAFAARTGLATDCATTGERPLPAVPPAVARQLLTIVSEALENAHRHAAPTRVAVRAGMHGDHLRVSVHDDGRGLPPGTTLTRLRQAGHFGLVGMVERAASLGARIRIGRGGQVSGTEVRVDLPLAGGTPGTTVV